MKTSKLLHLSELVAQDLLTLADEAGLSGHELLMVSSVTNRLLQRVVDDDPMTAIRAMQEAEATFVAVSTQLEAN